MLLICVNLRTLTTERRAGEEQTPAGTMAFWLLKFSDTPI
jgi:hypothetical protein